MKVKSFLGGFDKNFSYLIWCEKTKLAAVIDPSTEPLEILESIESRNLILSKILITHTHHDHITYLNDYKNVFSNLMIYSFHNSINLKEDYIGLIDNDIINIGDIMLTTLHTPGHFSDSVCYWNKKNKYLFTGDTMFVSRTGRVVGKHSNINDLYNSIYKKILMLNTETLILPGHNYGFKPSITIKDSIKLFDFFQCSSLEEFKIVMMNYEKNR